MQLIALANVTDRAGWLYETKIANYLERGSWLSPGLVFGSENVTEVVHQFVDASEIRLFGRMPSDFCLSAQGYQSTIFNLVCGVLLVYLFIFADMWKVIWNTTITRQFPSDPNYLLMMVGTVLLICENAAILTWLGVESGLSVIANSGEFFTVLLDSLVIFIILSLDDYVLPLVRFIVEEAGWMNPSGDMMEERLTLLTHGSQYYKPGYGHHWAHALCHDNCLKRTVAFFNIWITLAIVVAPLVNTIYVAINSFAPC